MGFATVAGVSLAFTGLFWGIVGIGMGQFSEAVYGHSQLPVREREAARWTIDHEVPAQSGNHHPMGVPMGCFAVADGYVNHVEGQSGNPTYTLSVLNLALKDLVQEPLLAFASLVYAACIAPVPTLVVTAGMVFIAVMADRLFGFEVGPRQWIGLSLTAIGLVLLGVVGVVNLLIGLLQVRRGRLAEALA